MAGYDYSINTKINDYFSSCAPVFLFEIGGDIVAVLFY